MNAELDGKTEQVTAMQKDLKNRLDNVNVGMKFLDTHLVKRCRTAANLTRWQAAGPLSLIVLMRASRQKFSRAYVTPRF